MKMELIEGSETSAVRTQTPRNYPKENIVHNFRNLRSQILGQKLNLTKGCLVRAVAYLRGVVTDEYRAKLNDDRQGK